MSAPAAYENDGTASKEGGRWNVLVTAQQHAGAIDALVQGLRRFGEFDPTPYACVCVGRVQETSTLLDALREAEYAGRSWMRYLSRVVPVVRQFEFVPASLSAKLELAAADLLGRARSGTFQARAEWRGAAEHMRLSDIEETLAAAFVALAPVHGMTMQRAFDDPDYFVAIEIVGDACGVGLLSREMRARYPFVRVR